MLLKRLFDVVSATLVLLLLAPVFLFICIWIKLSDKGPMFFIQERIGQFDQPFSLYKFRSMIHDPTNSRRLVTSGGDSYITRPGVVLRRYKLDELPQLLNVIAGQMSVVGPRPEVQKYLDHYSADDRAMVLSVKPGLTDYAAIEYRDEESELAAQADPEDYYIRVVLPKKIALYKKYVNQSSFWIDLKLIFATLASIVR